MLIFADSRCTPCSASGRSANEWACAACRGRWTVIVLAEAEGGTLCIHSCGDLARGLCLLFLLLRGCSRRGGGLGLLLLLLGRCLRRLLSCSRCGLVLLLHRVVLLPLARGPAGLLVSVLPVVNLAGLGAIGHDLAAGAVTERLPRFGAPPTVAAGLRVFHFALYQDQPFFPSPPSRDGRDVLCFFVQPQRTRYAREATEDALEGEGGK